MSESSIYILNTGMKDVEENRLTYQHQSLLTLTKTLIPPSIRSHLASLDVAPAVADVGTGTGVWLVDLAAELPKDARLDGYDIDRSKFLTDLPSNVKFGCADIFKPFPLDLHKQYDLVHVRLLMFALKADEWVPVAKNLRTLLKPGGYLMWEETGLTSYSCSPMTESFQKWIATDMRFAQSVGRDTTSPMRLEQQLQEAGYVCTAHQDFPIREGLEQVANACLLAIGRQSLHGMVARGGFEWVQSHEGVDKHFDKLEKECTAGICKLGTVFRWTIGQNPKRYRC